MGIIITYHGYVVCNVHKNMDADYTWGHIIQSKMLYFNV